VGSSGSAVGLPPGCVMGLVVSLADQELFSSSGNSGTSVGVGTPGQPPEGASPNGISGNRVGLGIDPTVAPVAVPLAVPFGHHHPLPVPPQPGMGVHGLMGGLKYDDKIFQMSQCTASGTRFV
jgi:hypothetical protein